MALVQPTNLNAFYADLDNAKRELAVAEGNVKTAEARLVEAGGKLPKKAEAPKAKKGKGKK